MLKVVNPPHTKLVKRLRDGSSKIIYILNTQKNVQYDLKNCNHRGGEWKCMVVKDQWLRDYWKRMDIYITDLLCCAPETNKTLSINYAPIKINK